MADIVVKCIDSIFYSSEKSLGRHHISASYFEHLTPFIVIFATVCIYHAIGEWKSGVKIAERFDFGSVNCKALLSSIVPVSVCEH
jgi:Domain of unknown function (DUF6532)